MPYVIRCPDCSTKLRTGDPVPAGTAVTCPKCGAGFTLDKPAMEEGADAPRRREAAAEETPRRSKQPTNDLEPEDDEPRPAKRRTGPRKKVSDLAVFAMSVVLAGVFLSILSFFAFDPFGILGGGLAGGDGLSPEVTNWAPPGTQTVLHTRLGDRRNLERGDHKLMTAAATGPSANGWHWSLRDVADDIESVTDFIGPPVDKAKNTAFQVQVYRMKGSFDRKKLIESQKLTEAEINGKKFWKTHYGAAMYFPSSDVTVYASTEAILTEKLTSGVKSGLPADVQKALARAEPSYVIASIGTADGPKGRFAEMFALAGGANTPTATITSYNATSAKQFVQRNELLYDSEATAKSIAAQIEKAVAKANQNYKDVKFEVSTKGSAVIVVMTAKPE